MIRLCKICNRRKISVCGCCQYDLEVCTDDIQFLVGGVNLCKKCFVRYRCQKCGVWNSETVITIDISPLQISKQSEVTAIGRTLRLCKDCQNYMQSKKLSASTLMHSSVRTTLGRFLFHDKNNDQELLFQS